jgi:hypothetical protein
VVLGKGRRDNVGASFACFFSSVALVEEFVEWRATQNQRTKGYCCRLTLENRAGAIMRRRRSPTGEQRMNTIRLSAMVALGFALLTGNAPAQQQITVPPPPSTPVSPGVAPLRSQIQSPLPPLGTGVVVPIPLPTPQLLPSGSTFTTCTSNCDIQAMNCQSACVPAASPAANPATVPATGACNLSCASQQLTCKQSCGPGQ